MQDSTIEVTRMDSTHYDLQVAPARVAKRRFLETDKKGATRQVWRRIGDEQLSDEPINQNSRPPAQVGETRPPTPAARSTHSFATHTFTPPAPPLSTTERAPPGKHEQETRDKEQHRKLIASIPEALLSKLRANCKVKTSTSLLGRIQGKHPGLKTLTAWARETLHPSLSLLSLKSNNLFEVAFEHAEGRLHALKQVDLVCDSATIFFSSWKPHVTSRTLQEGLDHPVWVQIVNLCQILRDEAFLRTIGEQLGQVIDIDNLEVYKAKLFGPRICLLVQDVNNLPQLVVIPRLDGEGVVEYDLEFSGLPNQCGRCRSRDHQVRHCPKRETQERDRGVRNEPSAKGRDRATRPAPVVPHIKKSASPSQCRLSSPPAATRTTTPADNLGIADLESSEDVPPYQAGPSILHQETPTRVQREDTTLNNTEGTEQTEATMLTPSPHRAP